MVANAEPATRLEHGRTVQQKCSNANEVELFLNGKSLGFRSKKGDDLHVKWRVPFVPGLVQGISRKSGKTVLTSEMKTAGEPYKLVLTADRPVIKSDGADLSFVTVEGVDRNGVLAPRADNLIRFLLRGQGVVAGVDNGSETSMESFKGQQHTAMNGKALCIVQSNGKKGTIKLTAKADGRQPATIVIKAN